MKSRETLKESAADIRALELIISGNRTALATAQKQAETAQTTLKLFDGLNARIAAWRAGEIRAKRTPGRLPATLRDKQESRQNAQQELEMANETAELIAGDLRDDEAKLATLKANVMPAAAEVVHAEIVAPLAQQLVELNRQRYELERLLRGWMALRIVDQSGWVSLGNQADVAAALAPYHPGQEFIVTADPQAMQTSRFKKLVDELIANPEVELQTPSLVEPKDFF